MCKPKASTNQAFSSGRRGTAIAVDEVLQMRNKTPHPSGFACHLLPQEKAFLLPHERYAKVPLTKMREGRPLPYDVYD